MGEQQTVLAGSDGSRRSGSVLDAAAREASALGARLAVVTVVREAAETSHSLRALLADEARAAELADRSLEEAVTRVRARYPALEVTTHRLDDRAVEERADLPGALAGAALLVVGSRGPQAQPAFGLGSVSRHLLRSTTCPVLVVPDEGPVSSARGQGPVVAGLDDDGRAGDVLGAAQAAAERHGTSVLAVHAYHPRAGQDEATAQRRAEQLLGGSPVDLLVAAGDPSDVLVEHAAGASALVLGTRGPAALAGLAVDSVSRRVLDAAPCPVLLLVPRTPPSRRGTQAVSSEDCENAPGSATMR